MIHKNKHLTRVWAILLAILGGLVIAQPVLASNPAPVQTYFVPLPEDPLFASFDTINPPEVSGSINTLIAIAVAADGTIIYYDHWEDGYEIDVTNPTQSTTQIWGDGNPSNGAPPQIPGDVLRGGDAIILENQVPIPRNPNAILFDGRDRIQASFPVAVTRGAWPQRPGSLLGGAVEVFDADSWGASFVVPVGENTPDLSGTQPFEYSAAYVMARQDNTEVRLNGQLKATLNAGENYVVRVRQGDSITSNQAVQVDLATGDINSGYEMRWYALVPRDDWSGDYYTPVGHRGSPTKVWLYNPGGSSLTVSYDFRGGRSPDGTISVPAGSVRLSPAIPDGSGARFYASGDFFALTQTDTSSGGTTSDWGHPLVPAAKLTSEALVGWGYGNTNNNPNRDSRSVVWVTPVRDATIQIDFNGDGVVDNTRSVSALANLKILDDRSAFSGAENDQDMTGARIFATDRNGNPVDIAVAWGQDPTRSQSGDNDALDAGTLVPPLPLIAAAKTTSLVNDADGNGEFSPGDTMKYVIRLINIGRVTVPSGAITILDTLPSDTTYVLNSTRYNDGAATSPIADAGATAFPLDEGGIRNIAGLSSGAAHEISFDVTIDTFYLACLNTIVNRAQVLATDEINAEVNTPLFCDRDFGDAPDSYGTSRSANGANHVIVNTLRLGAIAPDRERSGFPSANADGDDTDHTDDEDGVPAPLPPVATTASGYTLNGITVFNNSGNAATLLGWIDFNRNGKFDAAERASVAVPSNASVQTVSLTWSGLSGLVAGQSYVRLRLSDQANLTAVGPGRAGEVEDYPLQITSGGNIIIRKHDGAGRRQRVQLQPKHRRLGSIQSERWPEQDLCQRGRWRLHGRRGRPQRHWCGLHVDRSDL